MDAKIRIVNLRWIVGILAAIVIALLTAMWAKVEIVNDHISFAATLMSLLLAVLAIVYAFVSNSQFSNNISALLAAANKTTGAAQNINSAAERLEEIVAQLPSSIARVEQKIDSAHQAITQKFSEPPPQRTAAATTATTHPAQKDADIQRVISGASLHGLIAIYLASAVFAKGESKATYDLNEVPNLSSYFKPDYIMGFLVGTADFLNKAFYVFDGKVMTVKKFPKMDMKKEVRSEIDKRKADPDYLKDSNFRDDTFKLIYDAMDEIDKKVV